MTERRVGKVEILPIRQIFAKEAPHFTRWLESNIEALAERLGMELSVIQREKQVGDFNVDLLCEDADQRPVIIENQLEKTDHDHLGKVLTYLVNLNAGSAIWVTSDARTEHERVIDWLNESTPADISFYLVKVEGIRIGTSDMAPYFTVLAGPDYQAKKIGEKKKEWADRHFKREAFWKSLLDKSRPRTQLFSGRSSSKDNWISVGAGQTGLQYVYVIWMDGAAVELYIDVDKGDGAGNKRIFQQLHDQREEIEKEFGAKLEWQELENRRASRIRFELSGGGLANESSWPSLQDAMIETMIKFDIVLKSRVEKIRA